MKESCKCLFIAVAFIFTTFLTIGGAIAAGECVEFNGVGAPDGDGDCIVDYEIAGLPEGTEIDNCPNARNGNCDTSPAYCNLDGSYDGSDPSTLSDAARRAGFQMDWNGNGIGDACDDADGDGVLDYIDNCKSVSNPDQDSGYCDDTDNDMFDDESDNCPETYNTPQIDSDEDDIGNACDNCILKYNPDQADDDDDGFGNLCPDLPNDTPAGSESPGIGGGGNTGSDYQFGPDRTQGNGGCSFTGASTNASAFLAIFMTLASMVFVRKIRS
ncbi:MAG: hypothetical protein HN337_03695 [Deltaproteobacteria bacterium]|nr:hypothetical protein [Deltaproteobacteria bacterium]